MAGNRDIYRNDDNDLDHNADDGNANLEAQVRRETWERFKHNLGENMRDTANGVKESFTGTHVWFREYFEFAAKWSFAPYIIPTLNRQAKTDDGIISLNAEHPEAMILGAVTGGLSWIAHLGLYAYLMGGDAIDGAGSVHWGYLAIPVVANLIDGFVYEPLAKTMREMRDERRENR
jgi:hypothetical protein